MSEIACTAIIRGRCIIVKRWEIQQFNTIQDHDGASIWYRGTAHTFPNDLQIPLVSSGFAIHTLTLLTVWKMKRLHLDKETEKLLGLLFFD